jgi:hypothetical protein
MLDVTYKTAWFMAHRIRESMSDASPSPIGGDDKVIEADETYVGGKAKNRAYKPEPKKHIVMTLSEAQKRTFTTPYLSRKARTRSEAEASI